MMNSKKGNAFVWLVGLSALFLIAVAFTTITPAFETIFSSTSIPTNQNYTNTRNVIQTSWQWWPALTLIGVILWMLAATLKTDRYGGYG